MREAREERIRGLTYRSLDKQPTPAATGRPIIEEIKRTIRSKPSFVHQLSHSLSLSSLLSFPG